MLRLRTLLCETFQNAYQRDQHRIELEKSPNLETRPVTQLCNFFYNSNISYTHFIQMLKRKFWWELGILFADWLSDVHCYRYDIIMNVIDMNNKYLNILSWLMLCSYLCRMPLIYSYNNDLSDSPANANAWDIHF